jgi:hypothetical protein
LSLASRKICSLLVVLLIPALSVFAEPLKSNPAQLLPEKVGVFRARGESPASPVTTEALAPLNFGVVSQAARIYAGGGETFSVEAFRTGSYSAAYAMLTTYGWGRQDIKRNVVGTAAIVEPKSVSFFRGTNFVRITQSGKEDPEKLLAFARALAETFEAGDNDVPVLIKHLPAAESVQGRTLYIVSSGALKQAVSHQPIINDLTFDGGTEAALAYYGTLKLLLVEFNTPQLATENNTRISARILELRNQGQPVPTAYRRVGNYLAFVFDAPTELAGIQLIDQVKYQQVVQWLGENPYSYREAVAEFTQTTLGVLVSVVKASGLVLLGSLIVGGFFGTLLFTRRRAQQQLADDYSDAGGMLRLNIDEVTPESDSARLLGPGN